jgi:hypothetical protein
MIFLKKLKKLTNYNFQKVTFKTSKKLFQNRNTVLDSKLPTLLFGFFSGILVGGVIMREVYLNDKEETKITLEERFFKYADINQNGKLLMSPNVFIESILSPKPKIPWVIFSNKNQSGWLIQEIKMEIY